MSLIGKGKATLKKKKGGGGLKKLGNIASKGLSALGGLSSVRGAGGMYRRRRSRGITARQFRTAQRVLKKIVKMYAKLPRRASHHGAACKGRAR